MRRQLSRTVDDLDGFSEASPVCFGLEGSLYEIDLSRLNAERLRSAFAPFISRARQIGHTAAPEPEQPDLSQSARRPARTDPEQLRHMRRWAFEHGHLRSVSCHLTRAVKQAYQDAHAPSTR